MSNNLGNHYNPGYVGGERSSEGYMRKYLDDMAAKMERPGAHFDRVYLEQLETCMGKFNDTFL